MASSRLSTRLSAVSARANGAAILIDVGTDHALLPLAWLQAHPKGRALGIDCAAAPLVQARANRERSLAGARLELLQQDGLGALPLPQDCAISICGMGAQSMLQILDRAQHLTPDSKQRLILAPQDQAARLREGLGTRGFAIIQEDALWDRGRYYPIIVAQGPQNPAHELDSDALEFGPHLLAQAHPALGTYLEQQINRYRQLCASPHRAHEDLLERLESLRKLKERYFAGSPCAPRPPSLQGKVFAPPQPRSAARR